MNKKIFSFTIKDFVITFAILIVTTLLCLIFAQMHDSNVQITMLYSLAVLLISRYTKGYFYGVFSSVVSVAVINYYFTYPYFAFNLKIPGYPITFFVMLTVCIITSASTTQIMEKEKMRSIAENERMRANLLRAVSHDLRTPLTSISGAAGALYDNDEVIDSIERKMLLKEIQEDAQWLIRMVENLLAVTRINSKNEQITKTSEAVEEIASEAVLKLKKRYLNAPVSVSVPDDVLFARMDPILIEQVLINLMENSIRHGKNVTKIKLEIFKKDKNIIFSVKDDGCGFDVKQIRSVFVGDIATSSQSDVTKNMGIGLSVCNSIIKAHGGKIFAENLKPQGAHIYFSLPGDE